MFNLLAAVTMSGLLAAVVVTVDRVCLEQCRVSRETINFDVTLYTLCIVNRTRRYRVCIVHGECNVMQVHCK